MVLVAAPALGLRDRDGAEVALIIDLSRQPPQDPNPYITEYERMLYPTVRIKTGNSTGSGVIFYHEGTKDTKNIYVLTASHVVGDNSDVRCEIWDGDGYPPDGRAGTIYDARVVITDTLKDLALITIHNSSLITHTYSATLAPRNYTPYLFRPVYTIGCSLGLTPRPSQGIISVIEDTYWEVSSPILPGNSGGPVYDSKTFEVIGIAVWVRIYKDQLITTMGGIVPINQVYEFLESIESKKLRK